MSEITFITSHPAKAEQLSLYLNYPVGHQNLDLLEIQSLDVEEVALHKAEEAYKAVQAPVLVEDVSIEFLALGRLPGTFLKWFLHELGAAGLCKLLNNYKDKRALIKVAFAFCNGRETKVFLGEMNGRVADKPRGEELFGTDSIFIPEGWDKTWGEMTLEEQKQSSVRKIALEKLESFLKERK